MGKYAPGDEGHPCLRRIGQDCSSDGADASNWRPIGAVFGAVLKNAVVVPTIDGWISPDEAQRRIGCFHPRSI